MRGEIEKRRLTRFVFGRNMLHGGPLSLADLCTLQMHLYSFRSVCCRYLETIKETVRLGTGEMEEIYKKQVNRLDSWIIACFETVCTLCCSVY